MILEYDEKRDLLYIYLNSPQEKVVETKTIAPGIFLDLDKDLKPIGIELLEASSVVKDLFEFKLVKAS